MRWRATSQARIAVKTLRHDFSIFSGALAAEPASEESGARALDAPTATVKRLVDDLASGRDRRRAAASAPLFAIGADEVITTLASAAHTTPDDWILATLGRMPPARVRWLLAGDSLLPRISPMLLTSDGANWLASEAKRGDLSFRLAQDLA